MAMVNQQKWLKQLLLNLWSIWPPLLGSGIRVKILRPDLRHIQVTLKLHFWNRNFFGTQYGGSLFSMTDPFFSVMLIENLGRDYIVWDKSASIRYLKPGKTDVRAEFILTEEILTEIREELKTKSKMDWVVSIPITDRNEQIIAQVEKVLYIRRKESLPT